MAFICSRGVMAATLDLGSSPERGVGSSPTESTTGHAFAYQKKVTVGKGWISAKLPLQQSMGLCHLGSHSILKRQRK